MKKVFLILLFLLCKNISAQWVNVNPPDSIYLAEPYVTNLTICNDYLFAITEHGIYKSSDEGISWVKVLNGDVYNLRGLFSTNKMVFVDRGGGIISRSPDNGVTWETINLTSFSFTHIRSFAYTSSSIFVGTDFGIFRSTDDGLTWQNTSNGLPPNNIYSDPNLEALIFSIITINNEEIFALNYNGIYHSTDNGDYWEHIEYSNDNELEKTPYFLFADNSIMYASVLDDGVYRSTNNGATWTKTELPEFTFVESFASKDSLVYAQTYNTIYKTSNNDDNWEVVSKDYKSSVYGKLLVYGSKIFQCFLGVSKSSDNGTTWIQMNNGLGEEYKKIVESFDAFGSVLTTHTSDMKEYISTDNGQIWIEDYITETNISTYMNPMSSFFKISNRNFLKNNNNNQWRQIYGPSSEPNWTTAHSSLYTKDLIMIDTFFISVTNQGVCRTSISNDKLFRHYTDLKYWETVFTESDGYTLTIGENNIFLGTNNGVYVSTDMGISWEQTSLQNKVILYVFATGSNILACSNNETFRSNDMGNSWHYIDIGLSRIDKIAFGNDNLFAVKFNRVNIGMGPTIRRRPFNEIMTDVKDEQKLPKEFSLSQNYPNPFNPTTTIKFSIPAILKQGAVHVQLKVFDLLGREVATLINEEKTSGNYEIIFNGKDLASGVYFYNLQTGSFTETKKLMLIK